MELFGNLSAKKTFAVHACRASWYENLFEAFCSDTDGLVTEDVTEYCSVYYNKGYIIYIGFLADFYFLPQHLNLYGKYHGF